MQWWIISDNKVREYFFFFLFNLVYFAYSFVTFSLSYFLIIPLFLLLFFVVEDKIVFCLFLIVFTTSAVIFETKKQNSFISNYEFFNAKGRVLSSKKGAKQYISKVFVDEIDGQSDCILTLMTKKRLNRNDEIEFFGQSRMSKKFYSFGDNFLENMRFKNECGTIFVYEFEVLKSNPSFIENIRQSINKTIDHADVSQNTKGIMISLILGETGHLKHSFLENIRNSGCAHILAISGLHVSVICFFIRFFVIFFVKRFRPRWLNFLEFYQAIYLISIAFVLLYVNLAGLSISAFRSFLMFFSGGVCFLIKRKTDLASHLMLSLGFFCLLAVENIHSISLQFSFLATFIVVKVYSRQEVFMYQNNWAWFFRYISASFFTSSVVSFVLAPLEAYYFNRIQLLSPIGNLLIVPVIEFIILPLSFFAVCLKSNFLMQIIEISTIFVENVSNVISQVKFSYIRIPQIHGVLAWFLTITILIFLVSKNKNFLMIYFSVVFLYCVQYRTPDCIFTTNGRSAVCRSRAKTHYCLIEKKDFFAISVWRKKLAKDILRCDENFEFLKKFYNHNRYYQFGVVNGRKVKYF